MLEQSVQQIKGVGEKLASYLNELGIYTISDLLFYFPFRYDEFEVKPLTELVHNETATLEGKVATQPSLAYYGKKKSRLTFTMQVGEFAVKVVMFNRAFAKKNLETGDVVTVTGKFDMHRLQLTATHFKKGEAKSEEPIQPVYSVNENVKIAALRKVMKQAVEEYGSEIEEVLPPDYLDMYKLPARSKAVRHMHFPESRILLKHARRRFTYEEFLVFQLRMQLLRKKYKEATSGTSLHYDNGLLTEFVQSLPFTLTEAQKRSLAEILKDMKSPHRMNRLLQGDVGSGKTVVAAISMYGAVTSGKQAALMVPTEILAEQHAASLRRMFGERLTIALLTGSVKGKRRRDIMEEMENGTIDVLVGTHALIQEEVKFNSLGFIVIDEQHRFGVEQRRTLREKGMKPDVLFMTATPIPRTLAITAFGDMDVSSIDQMPSGRKEIETYWVKGKMTERVLGFIRKEVEDGGQAYVICPLIEESDKLDIQNAVELFEQLREVYHPDITVGLMHGKLSNEEKEEIMHRFSDNRIQILVSTTVVEVGVDVPNASLMVIYDADRFGLSQLHQLRGRVGRGERQSHCILLADPKGETGKERMKIMTETTDGFRLSEEDLKIRGPGDFFGKKQSGLPEFKVADMVHDYRALETARKDAAEIIENGWLDRNQSFEPLKEMLRRDMEKLDESLD
ncbi:MULTISPECIES: ATP-dependent DNA helicase RecG [Salimicrobium]|uniref:ATP-dependent DNA helicase RecG n=1 Tax=Salimicrobium jeotgali TaxID=1230341 RepID=K2GCU3_9BACI|nr:MULTISPECIES: ATP-dependent DNA helicase RecG [Salimicrobium]AKG04611.1 ATP-dependent DNA helicase RecG [Salimicrobium jeotgali]EKE32828.1 ATP-dependent DNA helicase RecG [Salimicrobium jeotgali]MBM7695183.1 ATP-dependent DNA helicase RecG [Salimicrobium jeotgali]